MCARNPGAIRMMKKTHFIFWRVVPGVASAAVLVLGLFFFFRAKPPKTVPDLHHYKSLRTLSVALILAEKPDAVSVCFADEGAESLRDAFAPTGLTLTNATYEGHCSVVVFSNTPREWSRLTSRVADSGILVRVIDAQNLKRDAFRNILSDFPFRSFHLWMPGEYDWLLIGRERPCKLKLEALFDLFADDRLFESLAAAGLSDPADLFASYAGTWEELKDAFAVESTGTVLPENFVTRDIPAIPWLSDDGIEPDILEDFRREARSRQVVRRLVLKGCMSARRGDEDGALDAWSAAWRRNPGDSMLLERLYRLAVNARAFTKVGNLRGAAKCYETMIAIRPTDIPVLKAYAECLIALGQRPLAEKVLERAQTLAFPGRE